MEFKKLPSNSEKVLLELVHGENPTKALYSKYNVCTTQYRQELDGIVRELLANGFIQIKWADDMTYSSFLTITQEHTKKNLKTCINKLPKNYWKMQK